MFFSQQLPLASLIEMSRALRHSLGAGKTLVQVFRQQARQAGPAGTLAGRVVKVLELGHNLESALKNEAACLPPLFLALAVVGERTGNLPEIFGALETYYRTQQKLRRQLASKSVLPLVQLVAAILVIAGLIFVLGVIAEMQDSQPLDPLGLGLTGQRGAILFLLLAFGGIAGLVGLYFLARRFLRQQARVDALLLKVPVIGPSLRALALARFCLTMRLTLDAAFPPDEALRLGLRATGNAAFARRAEDGSVRAKEAVTRNLKRIGLFTSDFHKVVAVAEESGRLPEVLRQQARQYEEEAERRLTALMKLAGYGIWLIVAILIATAIFRIALRTYLGIIDQF